MDSGKRAKKINEGKEVDKGRRPVRPFKKASPREGGRGLYRVKRACESQRGGNQLGGEMGGQNVRRGIRIGLGQGKGVGGKCPYVSNQVLSKKKRKITRGLLNMGFGD